MRDHEEPEPAPPRVWREWHACALLVGMVVVPLVVAAVHLFGAKQHYLPTNDLALIELRTRDVFHHPVLVGPWSRYGWNHPGGLIYYVLAAPYRLLGSRSIGLQVGALLVNALAIIGIGMVAFRRGRLPMAAATLVPVMLYTRAVGWEVMSSPWNPYLPLLPLLLLVLLVWSVAVDDLWMAPFAVAIASFCVQSHVGFAIESVALLGVSGFAVIARGLKTRPPERRRYWLRVAKVGSVTAAVGLLAWVPVVVGDLQSEESNLGLLAAFFTDGRRVAGLEAGLEVMGAQWGTRPDWVFGARPYGYGGTVGVDPHWWAALLLALGLAAAMVARWRRAWETAWLAVVVGVGLAAALVATSRAAGVVYDYLVRWTWIPGVALGILVLRGAWLAVPEGRRSQVGRVGVAVVFALVAILCVLESASAVGATTPGPRLEARARRLTRRVLAALPRGEGPVMLDLRRGLRDAEVLALQLERRGIPVEVTKEHAFIYGPERERDGGPYRAELAFVSGDNQRAPGRLVYRWVDPVTEEERRQATRNLSVIEGVLGRKLTDKEIRQATPTDEIESVYLVQP